jgi:HSP20 family protein
MAEVKIARTENPRYGVVPFLGTDFFRTLPFDWNPLALMRRFANEVGHDFGTTAETTWRPPIEVKYGNDKLLVRAELPGLTKEAVKVTITGDLLAIEGERKVEKEENLKGYVHTERSYGRFYRGIPIPEGANTENVVAEFANGVLEIAIPIPRAVVTTKEIPVGEPKPAAEVKN